ncbi:thioesterase family protein [Paenisporosarcina antarctica]|uniref:Thioesterase n=1 Tax=Paenisporosarcina antarctica TaxID=417367 RepID=A0A4P6ZVE7_9BACL|nr:thioesterase family protein [Paenisporosarcina antarctica]QBP40257.1 thioesterase [Paenisporosarcina antarctica]
MPNQSLTYENRVISEYVDYNGHMNDAAYAKIFSLAADNFIDFIGLDAESRATQNYTIFTLESHICYLQEARENEKLLTNVQLLDSDVKRLHLFFTMSKASGEVIATSEQMLMGINTKQGKPAPFPESVKASIEELRATHKELATPKQAGRKIGINR